MDPLSLDPLSFFFFDAPKKLYVLDQRIRIRAGKSVIQADAQGALDRPYPPFVYRCCSLFIKEIAPALVVIL